MNREDCDVPSVGFIRFANLVVNLLAKQGAKHLISFAGDSICLIKKCLFVIKRMNGERWQNIKILLSLG